MSDWYRAVASDMTKIPDCIIHFETEYEDARKELSLKGERLETHIAMLPGIVEYRFTQLQEVEAILEFLNIELKKVRTAKFKRFLEHYNKVLSSRDADKYLDGETDVINMALLVNEFALVRNKFLSISKGLDQKSYMAGHITRLRCAGLDDAQLN